MEQASASFSPLTLLDVTMRDGGLTNDFHFPDGFAEAVYAADIAAGIDDMEFGYRANKRLFDPDKNGKWRYCTDDDIRKVTGEHPALNVSVMVDVGRTDFRRDIAPKSESPVDLFRVATYADDGGIGAAEMIEYIAKMGYQTTCNLMSISQYSDAQIQKILDCLARTPVSAVYVVDSCGALYPEQIRHLTDLFMENLSSKGKRVGIHTHNNQQCALANTLEARLHGATMLDASVMGMGRGAGNTYLEALIGALHSESYRIEPILHLIETQMLPLKKTTLWGENTSYLLTGLCNKHPRSAIRLTHEGRTDYEEQYRTLKAAQDKAHEKD